MKIQSLLMGITLGAISVLASCHKDEVATLTTIEISDITGTSAKSGGSITDEGSTSVTERGICWSTLSGPNINNDKNSNGSGIGNYAVEMTDLEPNTTYYVRAYATNEAGTAYGNELSFTTTTAAAGTPTITTNEVTNIEATKAVGGGNVTDDGGNTVTEKGLCWSKLPNPTIDNEKSVNGQGTGSFSAELTGLEKGTTYFVRAYATSAEGTAYGNEVSFETSAMLSVEISGTTYQIHDQSVIQSEWGPMVETNATSQTDGQANTTKLAALSGVYAAKKCSELNVGGYDDWYLPASNELLQLYNRKDELGDLFENDTWFWSSTDSEEQAAYGYSSDERHKGIVLGAKDYATTCICVRKK